MNAHVSVGELFGLVLPRGCAEGAVSLLGAYFDDSGTHQGGRWGPSKIVAVAGILGTELEIESLDALWKEHLDYPLCGRNLNLAVFICTTVRTVLTNSPDGLAPKLIISVINWPNLSQIQKYAGMDFPVIGKIGMN